MRTVGEGQQKRYFVRDLALLLEEWQPIQDRITQPTAGHLRLPGTRPHRAHRPRLPHRGRRAHRGRQPKSLRPHARNDLQDLPPLRQPRSSSTPNPSPSSTASTSPASSRTPSPARSTSRAAATSSSTKPKRSSPSTSTPAATRAARTRNPPSSRSTSKPPTKSPANFASATWAA